MPKNSQHRRIFFVYNNFQGINKVIMDSDDENEDYQAWRGVPATIVLINAYNPSKSKVPSVGLVATCRMMRQHLRLASTHYIGVSLYGTESETSSFGLQNVTEICPLNLPNLDDYKKLQSTNIDSCEQAKDLILSDALWHCGKMFTNCKKQLVSRTILILTSVDVAPVESDHRPTYMRVSNLVESNITIKLINISEEDVVVNSFYENFLMEANGGKEVSVPKPLWDLSDIEKLMYQQSHRHLALAQLTLEIGNGLGIGVGVYSLLKSTNQPKNADLHRDTNAILTRVTKTVKVSQSNAIDDEMDIDDDDDNDQKQLPLLKSELLHYQEYGGQRIEFTDKEKKQMNNPFGPPMLKLLGFKPASMMCKEKWFLKPGYFLFPNEGVIEGSTVAFKAFHKACLEMSVVAICVLCTRINARPFIVALSPCSHPFGLDVEVGFDVIKIPFMETVRDVPVEEEEITSISEPHRVAMKHLIKDLVFEYKPDMFENPKMQSLYRAVEAIALAEDEMDSFVDTTKPNPEKFQGIQEDLFDELFGPFGANTQKRAAASKPSTSSNKRVKSDIEIDDDLLQKRISERKVHMYTIPQLKQILDSKDISDLPAMTGLKKNDFVELVYKHC